jgi:hypothetical protein
VDYNVYVAMHNGKLYMEFIVNTANTFYLHGLQEKTCKAEQDYFRTQGQTETSLKIEDLRFNKTYDQQPEFKRLSEFYIIIFLNKLKILENTKKNQNKTSMAKAIWPFRDLHAPYYVSGPRTDVPTEPSSHRPCQLVYIGIVFVLSHHYPKIGDLGP